MTKGAGSSTISREVSSASAVVKDEDLSRLLLYLQIESKAQAISFYSQWCKEQSIDLKILNQKAQICGRKHHRQMKAMGGMEHVFEYSYGRYVFVNPAEVPGQDEVESISKIAFKSPGGLMHKQTMLDPEKNELNSDSTLKQLSSSTADSPYSDDPFDDPLIEVPKSFNLSLPNLGIDGYSFEHGVSDLLAQTQILLTKRREVIAALKEAEDELVKLSTITGPEVLAQIAAREKGMMRERLLENTRYERFVTCVVEHHQEVVLRTEAQREKSIRDLNWKATEAEISRMTSGHESIVTRNKGLRREIKGVLSQAATIERQVVDLDLNFKNLQARAFIMFDANVINKTTGVHAHSSSSPCSPHPSCTPAYDAVGLPSVTGESGTPRLPSLGTLNSNDLRASKSFVLSDNLASSPRKSEGSRKQIIDKARAIVSNQVNDKLHGNFAHSL